MRRAILSKKSNGLKILLTTFKEKLDEKTFRSCFLSHAHVPRSESTIKIPRCVCVSLLPCCFHPSFPSPFPSTALPPTRSHQAVDLARRCGKKPSFVRRRKKKKKKKKEEREAPRSRDQSLSVRRPFKVGGRVEGGGGRKKRIKEIQHGGKRKGNRAFVDDPFPPPPASYICPFLLSFRQGGKAQP